MSSVHKEKYLRRVECFSSFCLASLHKDGAEIRRKKVYKSEMQMRKDCTGTTLLPCRTGRSNGAVGRREQLRCFHSEISSGHKTIPARASSPPPRLFRKLSLFRLLPDVLPVLRREELASFSGVRGIVLHK